MSVSFGGSVATKPVYEDNKGSLTDAKPSGAKPRKRKPTDQLASGRPFWRPRIDLNKHNLAALKFPYARITNVMEMSSMNATSSKAGYQNGMAEFQLIKGKPCPICVTKEAGHNNGYWLAVKADGTQYVCCYSANCKPKGERYHRGLAIPWTPRGIEDWTEALYKSGRPCPDAFLGVLRDKYLLFAGACDGVSLCDQRLVFKVGTTFVEIAYGFATATHGWPRARFTALPWVPLDVELAPTADVWSLSTPASAFYEATR